MKLFCIFLGNFDIYQMESAPALVKFHKASVQMEIFFSCAEIQPALGKKEYVDIATGLRKDYSLWCTNLSIIH